jgi:hypothetical protein
MIQRERQWRTERVAEIEGAYYEHHYPLTNAYCTEVWIFQLTRSLASASGIMRLRVHEV